ncbi:MAG TPA: ABC transporter permease, partial [Terriglobales bacterium]
MKFFARRLVRAGLLLLGVSVLCFLLMQMAPGSFFDELRLNPQVSPQTIAAMRMRYGLDRPMIVRFGCWLWSAARGDLGYSIAYHAPVTGILWTRAKNTLLLTVSAMFLTWMISIPLGVWAAVRRGHWSDRLSMLLGSLFVAVPEVVIALALLAAAVRWKFLPAGGLQSLGSEDLSLWGRWLDVSRHLVLPLV